MLHYKTLSTGCKLFKVHLAHNMIVIFLNLNNETSRIIESTFELYFIEQIELKFVFMS